MKIAAVSTADDIHALAVLKTLHDKFEVDTYLIPADRIAGSGGLTWSTEAMFHTQLPTTGGDTVEAEALDLIWWRRISFPQHLPVNVDDPGHIALINADCRSALQGLLLDAFAGAWVSHPTATAAAENKLVQLRAAEKVGLRIPRTLVSQNMSAVRRFREVVDSPVIIKAVRGTRQAPTLTGMLMDAHLENSLSLELAPAIYQEYIQGIHHLRVCVFGDECFAFELESEELDWRRNLDIPVSLFRLESRMQKRLSAFLDLLDLKMGVFDLKLDAHGEPIFLEVNPQGQFLFLEGLNGFDLTMACAQFLQREAKAAALSKESTPTTHLRAANIYKS